MCWCPVSWSLHRCVQVPQVDRQHHLQLLQQVSWRLDSICLSATGIKINEQETPVADSSVISDVMAHFHGLLHCQWHILTFWRYNRLHFCSVQIIFFFFRLEMTNCSSSLKLEHYLYKHVPILDCVCVHAWLCACVLLLNICALSSGGKQLPLPIPAHLWMRGVRAGHNVSCVSRKGRWVEWGQSDQAKQRARGASFPVTRTALFFLACTPMNKYNTDPLTPWFDSCASPASSHWEF